MNEFESVYNTDVRRDRCANGLQRQQIGKRNSAEPTKAAKTETRAAPVNVNWFATAGGWNPPHWSMDSGTVNAPKLRKRPGSPSAITFRRRTATRN